MRLHPAHRGVTVCAIGISQTIAWASSYYLPAILAAPMAREFGISPVFIFTAFSAAMLLSALIGPWSGAKIDCHGGRNILITSNILFATGLCLMGLCTGQVGLFAGWLFLGAGMGMGLYDSAFAALATIYGEKARSSIIGITLIAGFASTIGWPLSAVMEAQIGWRGACLGWAALHLFLALPLNALLPRGVYLQAKPKTTGESRVSTSGLQLLQISLLSFVFSVAWFSSTAMAVHLPRLLEAAGATSAVALAAGALIGPAQVMARIAEFTFLSRVNPLISTRLAALVHPLGAAILMILGGSAATAFTLLHGAGHGLMTIAKGTLPLTIVADGIVHMWR